MPGAISADGRYVAFVSNAGNLLSGVDLLPARNVYRYDRLTGQVALVSVNSAGTGGGNGDSSNPVISADGSVVAFYSFATNLSPLDTTTTYDIYARNLTTGTTYLVSVNTVGTGSGDRDSFGPVISADGSTVAFYSSASNLSPLDTNGVSDVFARNLTTGTTYLVSVNYVGTASSNNGASNAVISADGKVVGFTSYSTNLVPPGISYAFFKTNAYVRNLTTGTTKLVSVNEAGTAAGNNDSSNLVISSDGKVAAFHSYASNLTSSGALSGDYTRNGVVDAADYVIWRKTLGTTVNANSGADGSGNGNVGPEDYGVWRSHFGQATVSDTNTIGDVFVRNLTTGVTTLVSVNSAGTGGGNGDSDNPVISADGSVVVFSSAASNLSPLDSNATLDIYARNLTTSTTKLVSVNSTGTGSGNGGSGGAAISADGTKVAFYSAASNISPLDTDVSPDFFVRNLAANTATLVSVNFAGTGSGNNNPYRDQQFSPAISADGTVVAFSSYASDLVSGADYNGSLDVFVATIGGGGQALGGANGAQEVGNGGDGTVLSEPAASGAGLQDRKELIDEKQALNGQQDLIAASIATLIHSDTLTLADIHTDPTDAETVKVRALTSSTDSESARYRENVPIGSSDSFTDYHPGDEAYFKPSAGQKFKRLAKNDEFAFWDDVFESLSAG